MITQNSPMIVSFIYESEYNLGSNKHEQRHCNIYEWYTAKH